MAGDEVKSSILNSVEPNSPLTVALAAVPSIALVDLLRILANQSPIEIRVTAIWSPTETDARSIGKETKVPESQIYWDVPNRDGLEAVCRNPNVTGVVIALPVDAHAATLARLFSPPIVAHLRTKALLSFTPCCRDSKQLGELVRLYHKHVDTPSKGVVQKTTSKDPNPNFVWCIAEPLRYENFSTRVGAMTADLGNVLGGSLVVTRGWPNHIPVCEDQQNDSLEMGLICKGAAALLRNIFGSVTEVRSQTNAPAGGLGPTTVAGSIRFACGADVTVSLCTKSTVQVMKLTVIGTDGSATVDWDGMKGGYEVQRHLPHFEHPVVDATGGLKWSLSAWARCASSVGTDLNSPMSSLIDYLVGDALLDSKGATLLFSKTQSVLWATSWSKTAKGAVCEPVTVSRFDKLDRQKIK